VGEGGEEGELGEGGEVGPHLVENTVAVEVSRCLLLRQRLDQNTYSEMLQGNLYSLCP